MARRRKVAAEDGPIHMDERWAISYLDMMTVLFLTFVVLFSMSTVDSAKYEQLKNSLQTGFGQEKTDLDDTVAGVVTENPEANSAEPDPKTVEEKLLAIQQGIEANLEQMHREGDVEFARVDGALVVRIVSGETLFSPDNAALSSNAVELLDGITPVVISEGADVSVEGHADYRVPQNYATNWELSSDRAVKVVRHMTEKQKMPVGHASAVGFGSTRPMDGEKDSLDRNRRVEIVVMAEADDGAATEAEPATAAGE